MATDTYDKISRLKIPNDELEQAKFCKTLADEIAIRVKATIAGEGGTEVAVTDCGQLEVNEGVRCEVRAKVLQVTKNTPVEVKRDATILSGRVSVLLQAIDGDFKLGFEDNSSLLIFKITKGNFFEVKLSNDTLRVWVEPTQGTKEIAIAELK